MKKRALLIGCNYAGTKAELHGCVNDVLRMHKSLLEKFEFAEEDITVMIDTDKSTIQPTGVNIKKTLARLISEVGPGDVLFLHYSGHGTQVPAETGDEEDDGLDEAIVPCDLNLLTDDDFRLLFKKIKDGVNFTFVSDSCHSGGLIDHEKEQIVGIDTRNSGKGPTRELQISADDENVWEEGTRNFSADLRFSADDEGWEEYEDFDFSPVGFRDKSLSIETLAQMLAEKTGHEVKKGSIRTSLYELFGDNASPSVKVFVNFIAKRLHRRKTEGGESGSAHEHNFFGKFGGFLKHKFDALDLDGDDPKPADDVPSSGVNLSGYAGKKPQNVTERVADETGILVSGCMSSETSADANPSGDTSKAYGALSNAIQLVLQKKKGFVSNRDLVLETRKLLKKQGFTQHPCLYCSDANVSRPFICNF
ncbi:hypothetical protein R1sor_011955 [Riccia sorocarpa]|uniref:Peptidase C14 caspase domain-containing protein n=1 Tax=Riccia sorocarpa TaxID=122646 RepID=A0ABD3I8J3_9MARC